MEPTSEIRSRFRLFFLYLSHFAFSRIKFVFFFSFKNDFYTVVFGVKSQYKKKKSEGCGWVIAEATERERESVKKVSSYTPFVFSNLLYERWWRNLRFDNSFKLARNLLRFAFASSSFSRFSLILLW